MENQKIRELQEALLIRVESLSLSFIDHIDGLRLASRLNRPSFRQGVLMMVQDSDFSAKRLISVLFDVIETLCEDANEVDWTQYLYDYTLHLNFPDVHDDAFDTCYQNIAELILNCFDVLNDFEKKHNKKSYISRYPFELLTEEELLDLEFPEEYRRFQYRFKKNHVYSMMKLNYELYRFTTLEHICGVHYLALHIARQLKSLGVRIDLGRVSGAAAGHDIGKFGCKKSELNRVAYLHYHYTGMWFERYKMPYIRHIAVNHSTWDLELENLSVESLVLIYCDFCVKESQVNRKEKSMVFFKLEEAFHVILSKLDHVDAIKEMRYKKVYDKLSDFESFIHEMGVSTDPDNCDLTSSVTSKSLQMYAMMHGHQITHRYKHLAIEHNIGMMHFFRNESSLNAILEEARTDESHHRLRSYLAIFLEYSTYLTMKQKNILLSFLFERLTHPEEDVRKQCAEMMGSIIATYDEVFKKELPEHVIKISTESALVFSAYFKKYIEVDVSTTVRHRSWIGYSLATFVQSVLKNASEDLVIVYTRIVLEHFEVYRKDESSQYFLLKVLKQLPVQRCKDSIQLYILTLIYKMALKPEVKIRLEALDALRSVLSKVNPQIVARMNFDGLLDNPSEKYQDAFSFIKYALKEQLKTSESNGLDIVDASSLYLSNLKTATPPVVKRLQIEVLKQLIITNKIDAFYAAMHFSNVLKVSAFQEVRECAGNSLIEVFTLIAHEQKNDIVIELLRSLEIEGYQFTKYIPPYLGKLINQLSPTEHTEIIDDLIMKMKSASTQVCLLVLSTAAYSLVDQFDTLEHGNQLDTKAIKKMFGVLLNGLVHFNPQVNQFAFYVIGQDVFGSNKLTLDQKIQVYGLAAKKILTIITNVEDDSSLTFMNYACALNHMYRFISDALHEKGQLEVLYPEKVAFFPGAFDPFSLAHKESACKIRNLGFEVYLAVDEFSWSKRTQPNMVRRHIVKMSIADELDIYSFPRSFIVNIANADDLISLKEVFAPRAVYLVVGSDVLTNASAYTMGRAKEVLLNTPHILFDRTEGMGNCTDDDKLEAIVRNIKADVKRLTLDVSIESISSTQIRSFIDKNKDISDLTESLVQKYIYERGLYRREPQYKDIMTVRSLSVEIFDASNFEVLDEICKTFSLDFKRIAELIETKTYQQSSRLLVIRDIHQNREIQACSIFHWLRSSLIYHEIASDYLTDYIRDHAVGRLIVIDALLINESSTTNHMDQVILTETLAFCLEKDYSYAIYKDSFDTSNVILERTLENNGFIRIGKNEDSVIFTVDMSAPITLSLDFKAMVKSPYRNAKRVERAVIQAREKLQRALCNFYPGKLVLSFDRTMIYEHLIKIICDANNVPTVPTQPRQLGPSMVVPFGDVFKRWILPNTVTKALHTERYFDVLATRYTVKAYPNYLDLRIQAKTIKSFNRPVILVDDLMDKGYRLRAILEEFQRFDVPLQELVVAILSGRGKAWIEMKGMKVKSAYFIPRIRYWFNESHLYPFIGGDALLRSGKFEAGNLPSVNLILPYVYPKYIKDVPKKIIAEFSKVCLENAYQIMKALETEYLESNERNLTLDTLSEVMISPRCPERGDHVQYNGHAKPSDLLANDIDVMARLSAYYESF